MADVTTVDGTIIPGSLIGVTAHSWTADSVGLFQTGDLSAEWHANYSVMLAGYGDTLTALQRMEGNAEAVLENTNLAKLSGAQQQAFREDAQREYDAIWTAMLLNQNTYGIDPKSQFNSYTYMKMEETLQANEQLEELARQGHGFNEPTQSRYNGYTTNFQHSDGKTLFVGQGSDNGDNALGRFFDEVVLTHAPFPTVLHNGVLTQLNQNGGLEETLAKQVADANESAFGRVFVASDFSTVSTAVGAVVAIPNQQAAPALPVAPMGSIVTVDGTVIAGVIAGITVHTWTADTTGLYHTGNLQAEWQSEYQTMLAGHGDTLTAIQRMAGNAEAFIENTAATRFNATQLQAFREDAQREYDAIGAALQINRTIYGLDPSVMYSATTYLLMQQTLQANAQLKELAYQGHGVNNPSSSRYAGYTTTFQNSTDNKTYFVGATPEQGQKAIADVFDDNVLTHAPFATLQEDGDPQSLNQNGTTEEIFSQALLGANDTAYTQVYVASDFSTDPTAIGALMLVPNAKAPPSTPILAKLTPSQTAFANPAAGGPIVGMINGTTGASATFAMDPAAAGGPNYLQNQYIYAGTDSVAVSTQVANVFLHTGSGNDALQVASGQNVLDGGLGSNFMTGGAGMDTFFTDARGPGVVWNTMINFHNGDAATLWGFKAGTSTYSWDTAIAGATGSQGATLRANIVGGSGRNGDGVDASITFAGLSVAQAKNLQIATGTQAAGDYLFLYNPGV